MAEAEGQREREIDGRKLLWQLLVVGSEDLESTLQLKTRRLSTLDSTLQMGLMGSTQLDSGPRVSVESCRRKANANASASASAAFSCNYVADIKMKFPQFQQRQLSLSAFSFSLLLLYRVFFAFSILRALQLVFPTLSQQTVLLVLSFPVIKSPSKLTNVCTFSHRVIHSHRVAHFQCCSALAGVINKLDNYPKYGSSGPSQTS